MKQRDVRVIEKARPFDGYFKIDRYTVQHRTFEGGWTAPFHREVFERGHAVVVLLYDPDRDAVVLIEQFRIGAFAAADSPWFDGEFSPWLIECVAGIIDPGETPDFVARRETAEETGCDAGELIPMYQLLVSPGASTESNYLFCARVDSSNAGGIFGLDHEHENIRVLVLPAEEAFQWLDGGRILHSTTIICLQWLRINRLALKERWAPPA
jgi:ADP-ribose pyrophosphatase